MSGTYNAGFGDINAIIQNAATKPSEAPVMVYMLYNRAPFALITKADSPIKSLKDVEGKTLGSPAGGASLKVFPALAKKNGIDDKKVNWLNMAPNLQEQMLLSGQVQASAVFTATSYMNLVAQRIDPDKDIRWFYYGDYGLDLYSNGVMVSPQLIKERPQAVTGMVKGHQPCLEGMRRPTRRLHGQHDETRAADQPRDREAAHDLYLEEPDAHTGSRGDRHGRRQGRPPDTIDRPVE